MSKKLAKKAGRRSTLGGVEFVEGWVLICKDENDQCQGKTKWYIAWLELFPTKLRALQFAGDNKWPTPFKAVRAHLAALPD